MLRGTELLRLAFWSIQRELETLSDPAGRSCHEDDIIAGLFINLEPPNKSRCLWNIVTGLHHRGMCLSWGKMAIFNAGAVYFVSGLVG